MSGPQLVAPEPWMAEGRCRTDQIDTAVFFPTRGEDVSVAQRICRSCPVRTACLDYALDNDEHFGVWGGLSERARKRLRRGDIARNRIA